MWLWLWLFVANIALIFFTYTIDNEVCACLVKPKPWSQWCDYDWLWSTLHSSSAATLMTVRFALVLWSLSPDYSDVIMIMIVVNIALIFCTYTADNGVWTCLVKLKPWSQWCDYDYDLIVVSNELIFCTYAADNEVCTCLVKLKPWSQWCDYDMAVVSIELIFFTWTIDSEVCAGLWSLSPDHSDVIMIWLWLT